MTDETPAAAVAVVEAPADVPAKKKKAAPVRAKMTLVDYGEARDIISQWLAESEGEVTPEIETLLAEADLGFEVKALAVGAKIIEFVEMAKAAAERAKAIAARAKRFEAQADGLKRYLLVQMQLQEIPKLAGVEFGLALRQNPAKVVELLLEPGDLAALREQAEADAIFGVPDLAEPEAERAPRPTIEDLDFLAGAIVDVPEVVTPARREWSKDALKEMAETNPKAVAFAARVVRDWRVEVK